uniref:PI3K/PI4K domain-containing protein n=1 Tax=Macrostomum lignano TaxID=282301 RepID=A0A1I8F8T4_9PLAT
YANGIVAGRPTLVEPAPAPPTEGRTPRRSGRMAGADAMGDGGWPQVASTPCQPAHPAFTPTQFALSLRSAAAETRRPPAVRRHLRKAKHDLLLQPLPSSATLKSCFPDIRFDKNNTASEFFYIQVEKLARERLATGEGLQVSIHFLAVVQAALVEFYQALSVSRDQQPAWKKPIYRAIARLDQPVPDWLRRADCSSQFLIG